MDHNDHEHDQAQDHKESHVDSAPTVARHAIDPGRTSRSALLRKPDQPVASGLVQRKERNANGVAEGAEHVVAAASASSGSPLPAQLMRKFERSLGADLSGVRVHTGEASARAADAVSAKAYTMGNDIHFGAGHYDPSSTGGQHLLAHEVAHTVQQSGGTKRMQRKLRVSSPGDGFEHEADSAANAMISSGAATTTSVPGLPRDALQRAAIRESAPCALTTYTGTNFSGKVVTADIEFVDLLNLIDQYAGESGVKLHITHSFRKAKQVIRNPVARPAKKSNHLAGHAIDMNVSFNGKLYSSRKLKRGTLKKQPKKVRAFVNRIRQDARLRWGGDFSKQDPVHIDDGLNVRDENAWYARYKATQRAYKNRCG